MGVITINLLCPSKGLRYCILGRVEFSKHMNILPHKNATLFKLKLNSIRIQQKFATYMIDTDFSPVYMEPSTLNFSGINFCYHNQNLYYVMLVKPLEIFLTELYLLLTKNLRHNTSVIN